MFVGYQEFLCSCSPKRQSKELLYEHICTSQFIKTVIIENYKKTIIQSYNRQLLGFEANNDRI